VHIYIIADMEGHPACSSRESSITGTEEWKNACKILSDDLYSFSLGLNKKYSCTVTVIDFHRNAFNISAPGNKKRFYKVVNGYAAGKTFPLAIEKTGIMQLQFSGLCMLLHQAENFWLILFLPA